MATSSNTSDSRFNLHRTLKEASASRLLGCLGAIEGKKDIVLDDELICSLDYLANFTLLKTCNIEKIFKLTAGSSPGSNKKCVYLVRSNIANTKIIADHINANRHTENFRDYCIVYVPRKLFVCETILEQEGVYGYVELLEFPLGFLAVDKDLFSLELPNFYADLFLKGDQTLIHTAAVSLIQLYKICGAIPQIICQGRCSKMVHDLVQLILKEIDTSMSYTVEKITHLIILDRDIDYPSVLLSQLTYEGLLDETFGIKSSRIEFPKEVTGKDKAMKFYLSSTDVIYEEIRHSYFPHVFEILRNRGKFLKAQSETSGMSLGDIKKFVTSELKTNQQQRTSLSLHIGACEVITNQKRVDFPQQLQTEHDIILGQHIKECMTFIEDIINKQSSAARALRLLCLLSTTQGGLPTKDYESLVKQFLQSYGYQHILTTDNLRRLGLLTEQGPLPYGSKIVEKVATAFSRYSSFRNITKKFNLIPNPDQVADFKNPTDTSYVFGGIYCPLVAKLVEQVISNEDMKLLEEGLRMLPGLPVFNTTKGTDETLSNKTLMVFYLGGITYAEVAALRLIAKSHRCKILIATTALFNGNSLMRTLIP